MLIRDFKGCVHVSCVAGEHETFFPLVDLQVRPPLRQTLSTPDHEVITNGLVH